MQTENIKIDISDFNIYLLKNKNVKALACTKIDDKNWLIIVSDQRILLIYKAMGNELVDIIPKESLKNISLRTGIAQSELIIKKDDEVYTIVLTNDVTEEIQHAISLLLKKS